MRCATPRCVLLIVMVVLAVMLPRPSRAVRGAIQLTAEPGIALLNVRHRGPRLRYRWGVLGAASVAVGLTDLLWLRLHLDRKYFGHKNIPLPGQTKLDRSATLGGVTLVYNIDVLNVTPFVEIGAARARLTSRDGDWRLQGKEDVPVLGLGADTRVGRVGTVGLVTRYYPMWGSELLDRPVYTTFNARLGLLWRPGR